MRVRVKTQHARSALSGPLVSMDKRTGMRMKGGLIIYSSGGEKGYLGVAISGSEQRAAIVLHFRENLLHVRCHRVHARHGCELRWAPMADLPAR